jgi:3-deoxy-D-manno-octulosonic-acid transferase
MRRLYTLGLSLYLMARLPGFIVDGARGKHDLARRLREGFWGPQEAQAEPGAAPGPAVWVHACSMGEVLAARPLVEGLRKRFPGQRIVLSTVTRTGFDIARARLAPLVDEIFYFPFDLPGAVRRALDHVRPRVVVIVETEIWPNFLMECYRRGVAVVWVNGRISDRAFSRYQWAASLLAPLLKQARLFVMRTEEDARRIRAMGAPPSNIVVAGNLKYDHGLQGPPRGTGLGELGSLLARLTGWPLIVAGSTTEPEESIVLEALKIVRKRPGLEKTALLLAPRHPERFGAVAAMIEASGLSYTRRSQPSDIPISGPVDVILLDTIGELAASYAHADAVFVGGSFARRGGQSFLEPALHARAAVVGPHMENYREALADFKAAEAILQVDEEEPTAAAAALAIAWTWLLEHPDEAREMGRRAHAVIERNSGATERTLAQLLPIIKECCQAQPGPGTAPRQA